MTPTATCRILWAALLLTLPVPYWAMEGGWVPTFWLVELAGFTLAVLVTEGGSIVSLITGLFVLEALLATLVLYALARFGAQLLLRSVPEAWQKSSVVLMVLLLLASSLFRVYTTPLVAGGGRVNLLQLFA